VGGGRWLVGVADGGGSLPTNYNKFHGLSEAAFMDLREEEEPSPDSENARLHREKSAMKCIMKMWRKTLFRSQKELRDTIQ